MIGLGKIIRLLMAGLTCSIAAVAQAQTGERTETAVNAIPFSLAAGLELDLVAAEPLVKWPIVADWDEQGRLVVAESGGVGWPIQEHNERKLHKLVRLVDHDHDGRFDERIVAAESLAFPEGVLCIGNDILVAAPPAIWKFSDLDGDGICEQRSIWFDGQTVTNCANDLHGPYLGLDGWIYWCKGAFGEQTHERMDGRTVTSRAAHIFRRRLEGGQIEAVISGGMDNPVEVAFIPEGEAFFTSTFLQHPGGGLRDGIAQAAYGSLYGKDHAVINDQISTGALMPVMTQLGPAAPSGLACLHSDHLRVDAVREPQTRTLVAALFNLHQVTAHRLVRHGASYRTMDQVLLTTDRVDFHPTDVLEDAEGSLLVIDTGGWYDLCCPTSRIDQTTAAGGIYRIRRTDAETPAASQSVSWSSLLPSETVARLFDSRPWIRRQAGFRTQAMGAETLPPLAEILTDGSRAIDDRLTALWAVCRLGDDSAMKLISGQLDDPNASIVQAACRALSIHRSPIAVLSLVRLLDDPDSHVRRAAAEALGRCGDDTVVVPLIEAIDQVHDDRFLEHAILYALVERVRGMTTELLSTKVTELMSVATTPAQRRALILVIDQAGATSQLSPERLFDALLDPDDGLRTTAAQVLAKHPRWAADSLEQLRRSGRRIGSDPGVAEPLALVIAGWRSKPSVEQLLARWLTRAPNADHDKQEFLASQLHRFAPPALSGEWITAIAAWLEQADPAIQIAIATGLRQSSLDLERADDQPPVEQLAATLQSLAGQSDRIDRRLRLLGSYPRGRSLSDNVLEASVVAAFLGEDRALVPLASDVLSRIRLSAGGTRQLIDHVAGISPLYLSTAIEAIHRAGIESSDEQLLAELPTVPAARTLQIGFLERVYADAPEELKSAAAKVARQLVRPPAEIEATVDRQLASLADGDAIRGLQVFRSERAACSACHRMGYIGADIGPELTRIGKTRTAEALLEAILFPSARQEQSYQSTSVVTTDGRVHLGLIKRQSGDEIELQLDAARTVVIRADEIEQQVPSAVSVMPANLTKLLSPQELADLMALLRAAQ